MVNLKRYILLGLFATHRLKTLRVEHGLDLPRELGWCRLTVDRIGSTGWPVFCRRFEPFRWWLWMRWEVLQGWGIVNLCKLWLCRIRNREQIPLVVYTHYIAIPMGQACQYPMEGQSGQDTYFHQYRSATWTASIATSSQLGVNHPSCLILSCLARTSSYDNGLILTLLSATAVNDQFIM